ncbi:MAG: D-alanyl-D-alanine carboxypeptidase family protein [Pseudomonadota bacterium]
MNAKPLLWALAFSFSTVSFAAPVIAPAPPLDNTAYLIMDFDSGRVLAQSNAEQALPPASLTKMMTSYLVEKALKEGRLKLTDQVLVSENAWCRGTNAESCMYLPVHGSASVIDILRGIIIQSGNDASKAIAEHMAGSEASFAALMNTEAQRLGMKNTRFMNATGLPDPAHRASAHDLALLARAIIRDSADYYKIYAEKEFTYNGIKQGNRNALLYTDPTVDGLKTGHTGEAGFCLTASSKRGDMRLISVIMGAKSMQARADQTRALFNWAFGSFEDVRPLATGVSLKTAQVRVGKVDVVNVGLNSAFVATIPRGQAASLHTDIQLNPNITAPIAKGAVLGKVLITLDGQAFGEQNLVALEPVEQSGFFMRLWQRLTYLFK